LDGLSKIIVKYWKDLTNKPDEKQLKPIAKELLEQLNGGQATDLALFGRMLADLPKNNVNAACQVAHAISTHKVGREFDFYTAVDDLQKEDETGAGMMGDIEFNSACYYRYANIDLEQLKHNLNDDKLAFDAVEAFLRAAVAAVPTGKQTSFSAQNPPDFVFAVVRDAGTWSLANAFCHPIKTNGDLVEDSIDALVKYWGKLNKAYGTVNNVKAKPVLALKGSDFTGLTKIDTIDELVDIVANTIAGK
jgi:CRISPR system Cascade subunit CasC